MDDVVKGFYNLAQKIPYAEEKALAYYLGKRPTTGLKAKKDR